MTRPAPSELIRDGAALTAADHGRLLPAASAAGAQVRAVAEQVASWDRERFPRPRALVVVGPAAVIDAAVLSAVLPSATAPIVGSVDLPVWVGPLDVVVISAGAIDDDRSAVAAQVAQRRGAATLVRAAATGLVAEAAGAALLPVEIAVPEVLAGPGRWAVLAAVAHACGLGPAPDLLRWADLLDASAPELQPTAETYLNPAANLAEHLSEGTGLILGTDRTADALARHAARILMELSGLVCGVLPSTRATGPQPVLQGLGADRDLFADPFDDPTQLVRPVLLSTIDPAGPDRPAAALTSALRRTVPAAFTLDQAVAGIGSPAEADQPARPDESWYRALAFGQVIDTAAVYLAVARNAPLPADVPGGLGRSAGSRWDVRPVPTPAQSGTDWPDLES